jgi:UDP-N-acetyl-D-galactosamine dehydrogenase
MNNKIDDIDDKIAIVGMGYVGLPLAIAFSHQLETIGYDVDSGRITELVDGYDRTNEISEEELQEADQLQLSDSLADIADCTTYIITVPTPVDSDFQPDLSILVHASESVGSVLKEGDTVIYESTVYPGATEEVCVPALVRSSGLKYNEQFTVGYSPERINPGDRKHTLETVTKLTSGSTPEAADYVDNLYRKIVFAGTHRLDSIQEAEAAKVIENIQRDVNIALMNELAKIFERLDINTQKVLEAAGTKWNFLPFSPGLVGGHCIGIDPYYLDHKARQTGYEPTIIPASRLINESMGSYVAERVMSGLAGQENPKILIMGLSFKEDCPDLRNTKVVDIYKTLKGRGATVDVFDPWVNHAAAKTEHGIELIETPHDNAYDAIVLAVRHHYFVELGIEKIRSWGKPDCYIFDVKYLFDTSQTSARL